MEKMSMPEAYPPRQGGVGVLSGTVLGLVVLAIMIGGQYWWEGLPGLALQRFCRAIDGGDGPTVQRLIEAREHHQPHFPDARNLLEYAVYRGTPEVLSMMLTTPGLATGSDQRLALHSALTAFDAPRQVDMVRVLLGDATLNASETAALLGIMGTVGIATRRPPDAAERFPGLVLAVLDRAAPGVVAQLAIADLVASETPPGLVKALTEALSSAERPPQDVVPVPGQHPAHRAAEQEAVDE